MTRDIRYCESEPGIRIAYCVEGSGPPTIVACGAFIESFGLDHLVPVYQRFYQELGAGRTIVRFDLRGIGLSANLPAYAPPNSIETRAADLLAVIRANNPPVIVWAPIVSGPWAIKVAIDHPEAVSKLILCDTYADPDEALSEEMNDAFTALARANWPAAMQTIADTNGRREFPEEAALLGEWFARSYTPERYVADYIEFRNNPSVPDVSRVSVPTLVLHRIGE